MPQNIQLERRRLNEEIENAFITAAQAAANAEMKIASGKGNAFPDFQDFYLQFNYLVRLTMELKEMEAKEEQGELATLKKNIYVWLDSPITPNDPVEQHCKSGIRLFGKYYHELMHYGIISLPTKKG